MTATTRKIEGVSIVDLSGRITIGEGTVVLKEAVRSLLNKREMSILLNLGDVSYIDSSGLALFIEAMQRMPPSQELNSARSSAKASTVRSR